MILGSRVGEVGLLDANFVALLDVHGRVHVADALSFQLVSFLLFLYLVFHFSFLALPLAPLANLRSLEYSSPTFRPLETSAVDLVFASEDLLALISEPLDSSNPILLLLEHIFE